MGRRTPGADPMAARLLDRLRELGRRLGDALDELARPAPPSPEPVPLPVHRPAPRRRMPGGPR